jgi:hypothetical protein
LGGESAGTAGLGWWEWVVGFGYGEREREREREISGVIEIRKRMVRASSALMYNALYLHMWRVKMKIKCSSTSLSSHSKTQSATLAFHK